MADWDSEDFQPDTGFAAPSATDKWEGEDEDDGVKDSWEDEEKAEGSEGSDSSTGTKAYQKKKKKSLAERIAEKELAEKLEKEEAEAAKKAKKPLSAEEKLAEKLRLQKIQEDSDLKVARETFGISSGLDSFNPETQEEFVKFSDALTEKILSYQPSPCFTGFVEKLFTDLALSLEPEDVRKLGGLLNNIYHEKNRISKAEQDAKKKKKKTKASIRVGKSDDLDDIVAASSAGGSYGYDDDYI